MLWFCEEVFYRNNFDVIDIESFRSARAKKPCKMEVVSKNILGLLREQLNALASRCISAPKPSKRGRLIFMGPLSSIRSNMLLRMSKRWRREEQGLKQSYLEPFRIAFL